MSTVYLVMHSVESLNLAVTHGLTAFYLYRGTRRSEELLTGRGERLYQATAWLFADLTIEDRQNWRYRVRQWLERAGNRVRETRVVPSDCLCTLCRHDLHTAVNRATDVVWLVPRRGPWFSSREEATDLVGALDDGRNRLPFVNAHLSDIRAGDGHPAFRVASPIETLLAELPTAATNVAPEWPSVLDLRPVDPIPMVGSRVDGPVYFTRVDARRAAAVTEAARAPVCDHSTDACRCSWRSSGLDMTIARRGSVQWLGAPSADIPRFVGCEIEVAGFRSGSRYHFNRLRNYISDIGGDIVYDGSLRDTGREIRLPPLRGDSAIDVITEVCGRIRDLGGFVDERAGGHVHVDVRDRLDIRYEDTIPLRERGIDADMVHVHKIGLAWWGVEPWAYRAWAMSRSRNRYCRRARRQADTLEQWVQQSRYERYNGLNLGAFLRHKTVEFRLFGGAVKAETWIARCKAASQFVETACSTDSSLLESRALHNGRRQTAERFARWVGFRIEPIEEET